MGVLTGPSGRVHLPLLVIQVRLLLLETGGLRLHELVERGQLLPATGRRPPWCTARAVSTRDGRESEKGADALFLGICLEAPFWAVVVTMVHDGDGLCGAEISTWATWTRAGSTPGRRSAGGEAAAEKG